MHRRGFIRSLLASAAAVVAGPKVLQAMPEIVPVVEAYEPVVIRTGLPMATWRMINQGVVYGNGKVMPIEFSGFDPFLELKDVA